MKLKAKAAGAGYSYCLFAEMSHSLRKQQRWDWRPTEQGRCFGFRTPGSGVDGLASSGAGIGILQSRGHALVVTMGFELC